MMNPMRTFAAGVAAVLVLAALPLLAGDWHSVWHDNGRTVNLWMDGTLEFTADDHDIQTLSPGGRFVIEVGSFGESRRYEVRADSTGALTRTYSGDGRARGVEEARSWLAGTLPEVIRETAIGAGPRIQRIAQRGGASAAIREIGLVRSDHARRVYIEEMVSRVRLDDGQLGEAMRLVRHIGSDGEKARTIASVTPKYAKPGVRESMFEAIDTIGSDGERRRVLATVVDGDPSKETAALASKSAGRIGSDGEKAAILVRIAKAGFGSEDVRKAWMKSAASIGSDGEKRRVLAEIVAADPQPVNLVPVLRAASGIGSDGEKANLLIQAAREYTDSEAVRRPFFDAVNTIGSDGEHARVLMAFLERAAPPPAVDEALRSVRRISSSGEKSRVLQRIARESIADAAVSPAFFDAVDSVASDGERSRTLLAVVGRPGLPEDVVISVVRSAARISSDGEKGRVLRRAAEMYGTSRKVADELRTAAKTVSSDGEYRRVITALEHQNPVI